MTLLKVWVLLALPSFFNNCGAVTGEYDPYRVNNNWNTNEKGKKCYREVHHKSIPNKSQTYVVICLGRLKWRVTLVPVVGPSQLRFFLFSHLSSTPF